MAWRLGARVGRRGAVEAGSSHAGAVMVGHLGGPGSGLTRRSDRVRTLRTDAPGSTHAEAYPWIGSGQASTPKPGGKSLPDFTEAIAKTFVEEVQAIRQAMQEEDVQALHRPANET